MCCIICCSVVCVGTQLPTSVDFNTDCFDNNRLISIKACTRLPRAGRRAGPQVGLGLLPLRSLPGQPVRRRAQEAAGGAGGCLAVHCAACFHAGLSCSIQGGMACCAACCWRHSSLHPGAACFHPKLPCSIRDGVACFTACYGRHFCDHNTPFAQANRNIRAWMGCDMTVLNNGPRLINTRAHPRRSARRAGPS